LARQCKAERGREKLSGIQATCAARAMKEEQLDQWVAPHVQEERVETEVPQQAELTVDEESTSSVASGESVAGRE
jgi:hypothetical protein